MKFVHVTSARHVSGIKRHGLRLSGAEKMYGKGVYCVPLVQLPRIRSLVKNCPDPQDANSGASGNATISGPVSFAWDDYRSVQGDGYSSLTLWRWLNQNRFGSREATAQSVAVLFELSDNDFPVDFSFGLSPRDAWLQQILNVLTDMEREFPLVNAVHDWWRAYLPGSREEPFPGVCVGRVTVPNKRFLGLLIEGVLRNETLDVNDENFQIIIPKPVPRQRIFKILKLHEGRVASREKRRKRDDRRLRVIDSDDL